MMDPSGDKIRQILAKAGQSMKRADGATQGAGALGSGGSPSQDCRYRNLRGQCANPNLHGEYGMMSWEEYDALKAAGKDPEEVSFNNLNKPRPPGRLDRRSLASQSYR